MKRWLPVSCLVLVATTLLGASAWEGSAMMSAYGEFPDSGNYGACNSFPRNTAVEVVNLENGKTVTVIITKGSDNPGIFLLLSPEAAKGLSMDPGIVARVRVSAPRNITEALTPSSPTTDPDFNPSLLAAKTAESPALPTDSEVKADGVPIPEPEPEPEPETGESLAAEEPLSPVSRSDVNEAPAEEPVPEHKESELVPDSVEVAPRPEEDIPETRESPIVRPEALVRSDVAPMEERAVVAYLEVPESRESEITEEEVAVVYGVEKPEAVSLSPEAELADPSLFPDELPEAALLRASWPKDPVPSAELADCEIRMDESGKPEAIHLSMASRVREERVPEAVLNEPGMPSTEKALEEPAQPEAMPETAIPATKEPDSEIIVSLEPTQPKPPEVAPVSAPPEKSASSAPGKAPASRADTAKETASRFPKTASTAIDPSKFYIQIGAYKSSSSLDAAAQRLYGAFPVTIETVRTGSSSLYKLFIGPLGRDETGVMLVQAKALGFKDAFLRK